MGAKKVVELEKALYLRKEKRMSLKEISKELGVSKGSLSMWLRKYPLTEKEQKQKERTNRRPPEGVLEKHKPLFERKAYKKLGSIKSKFYEALINREITRGEKGRLSEAAVLFRLLLHENEVYTCMFDGEKIDFIIRNSSKKIIKVQVKTTKINNSGAPTISLRCSNGRKGSQRIGNDDVDVFIGYDILADTAYVYTNEEVAGKQNLISATLEAKEAWHKIKDF